MQAAGEESWRFSVADNDLLHTALFVRDSCGLQLPEDASAPPPLGGGVPDLSATLDAALRDVAGAQWLLWWRDILDYEAAKALGTLEKLKGPFGLLDRHLIVRGHLLDWPELDALASKPELREAVKASHDDAVRWRRQYSRHLGKFGSRPRHLVQQPISAIAQNVVDRIQVSAGRVRAALAILAVSGKWSTMPVPGFLLCSTSLAADTERLHPLLEAAFVSGVDAQAMPLPAREPKARPLPDSVTVAPVVLWERGEASLSCDRVIAYQDGFQIELRRRGVGPPPVPRSTFRHLVSNRAFAGLHLIVHYSDGREQHLDDVDGGESVGPIAVTTFGRRGSSDDTLWVRVTPLPPAGEVRLGAEWVAYGIEPVSASFDGAAIRARALP